MRAGVITFPGSNCDRDAAVALAACGAKVTAIWHAETDRARAEERLQAMCDQLLANPVIETYAVSLDD